MNSSRHSNSALPFQFQRSMRVLFDVMDANRSGYIKLADFERKWRESPPAASDGIPRGFLDCLRAVCPPNGLLTFERFCAGLRLSLAQAPTSSAALASTTMANNGHMVTSNGRRSAHGTTSNGGALANSRREQGVDAADDHRRSGGGASYRRRQVAADAKTANRHAPLHRVASEGSLRRDGTSRVANENIYANHTELLKQRKMPSKWMGGGILPNGLSSSHKQRAPPPPYGRDAEAEKNRHTNDAAPSPQHQLRLAMPPPSSTAAKATNRLLADDAASRRPPTRVDAGIGQSARLFRPISAVSAASTVDSGSARQSTTATGATPLAAGSVNGGAPPVRWRDKTRLTVVNDGRRHTVCEEFNGAATRNERMLDEERELIGKGLDTATRLVNWYNQRLSSLATREKLLGKRVVVSEAAVNEERLNHLRAGITELNRRLVALMDSSDKGFPARELRGSQQQQQAQPADDQVLWLQRLNKQLSEEIALTTRKLQALEADNDALRLSSRQQQTEQPDNRLTSNNANYRHTSAPQQGQAHQPSYNRHQSNNNHQEHAFSFQPSSYTSSSPSPISSAERCSPPRIGNGVFGGVPNQSRPAPPVPKKLYHATLM